MTHIVEDNIPPVPPPTFFERHSTFIMWFVGTMAVVFLTYSDLRVADTAMAAEVEGFKIARQTHDEQVKAQLDRIESKIQSIEEFLRMHDKAAVELLRK
jgi:hypothetical protein